MSTNNTILFYPNDVFNKYGFADGDIISDMFHKYCEDNDHPKYDSHPMLMRIIQNLVLPLTNYPKLEITCITTPHNPIRYFGEWDDDEEDIHLVPDEVYIPIPEIYEEFDMYMNILYGQ